MTGQLFFINCPAGRRVMERDSGASAFKENPISVWYDLGMRYYPFVKNWKAVLGEIVVWSSTFVDTTLGARVAKYGIWSIRRFGRGEEVRTKVSRRRRNEKNHPLMWRKPWRMRKGFHPNVKISGGFGCIYWQMTPSICHLKWNRGEGSADKSMILVIDGKSFLYHLGFMSRSEQIRLVTEHLQHNVLPEDVKREG